MSNPSLANINDPKKCQAINQSRGELDKLEIFCPKLASSSCQKTYACCQLGFSKLFQFIDSSLICSPHFFLQNIFPHPKDDVLLMEKQFTENWQADALQWKKHFVILLARFRKEAQFKSLKSRQRSSLLERHSRKQGCISCLTCSYPELTKDHVLTSAYVNIFRTVTRNALNKSV